MIIFTGNQCLFRFHTFLRKEDRKTPITYLPLETIYATKASSAATSIIKTQAAQYIPLKPDSIIALTDKSPVSSFLPGQILMRALCHLPSLIRCNYRCYYHTCKTCEQS